MTHTRHNTDEIARRGQDIYDRDIRPKVENEHHGKFLVVDVDTGDFEVDTDELKAIQRATARHPDGARYILRVGYPATHRLGARGPLLAR